MHRLFRGNNTIRDLPDQNDVGTFWRKICDKSKEFDYNAPLLGKLEKSYCTNVKPCDYTIDDKINKIYQTSLKDFKMGKLREKNT